MTLGWVMYSQDYDESFPQWKWDQNYYAGSVNPNNATSLWCNAIYPYIKNIQVFSCPSDARGITAQDSFGGWFTWDNTLIGFPQAMGSAKMSYGTSEPMTYTDGLQKLAAMDKPAETFIVADMITPLSGWGGYGDWVAAEQAGAPDSDPRRQEILMRLAYPKGPGCLSGFTGDFYSGTIHLSEVNQAWDSCARHTNGNSIGFADGHAKWVQTRNTVNKLFGVR